MSTLAMLAIASGIVSLLLLIILHFVSPEFKPSWRMVSEYALGKHKSLLTGFFVFWGLSTILFSLLFWNQVETTWSRIGLVLVFISGIGAICGGLFDLKHKLHGLSFAIGVPTLPIGALLVSYPLVKLAGWNMYKTLILVSAHATWISIVLMAVGMMLLFSGFKKAGVEVGPEKEAPSTLPPGVIAFAGYANRLLILSYMAWPVMLAYLYFRMG